MGDAGNSAGNSAGTGAGNSAGTVALHRHRGTRAIEHMVEHAPSTGGLALWVGHQDLPAQAANAAAENVTANRPPVATDGHTLFYDAAFDSLTVAAQAGWVAHEVLHVALRHPQRFAELQRLTGDADAKLFNVCADAIVNSALDHLAWLHVPQAAPRLDKLLAVTLGLTQGAESALLEWDVERLYRAIDDRRPSAARAAQPSKDGLNGQQQQQQHTRAGQAASTQAGGRPDGPRAARARALAAAGEADLLRDAQTQDAPEAEADACRVWSERIARTHAGDGAHSMLRVLLADVPRTRTPWEQVLRTLLARSLSHRPGPSWSRPARSYIANQGRAGPHRRMPWEPGTSATRAVPRLAVVVDESGSIDVALLGRFANEIEAISRRLEAALLLVVGDDRVQRVEHLKPGARNGDVLRQITFTGGGGTDFTPLLEEADRHSPDIAVVLTDLQGPANFLPRCPVIWAVPEAAMHPETAAPFGRLLLLR